MIPAADTRRDGGPDVLAPGEGWFVYGILPGGAAAVEDVTGLAGRKVVVLHGGRLAALVSPVDLERPPGRARELLAYSAVLDAVATRLPVVPVRFGAILPDTASVREELLAPDEAYFADLLEQLAGRAQYLLRVSYVEQEVLGEIVREHPEVAALRRVTRDAPADAAYAERVRLGELVARAVELKRDQDADLLLGHVLPLVDDHVLRPVSGLEPVCDVALLVRTEQQAALESVLEDLAEAGHERMRMRLLGPTAPYDFVEEA